MLREGEQRSLLFAGLQLLVREARANEQQWCLCFLYWFWDLHQKVTERDGQLHRAQNHLEIVIPLLKAGRHISYFVCAKATANNNCSPQLRLNKGATHMAQTKLIPSCAKHYSNFESEIRMAHKLN